MLARRLHTLQCIAQVERAQLPFQFDSGRKRHLQNGCMAQLASNEILHEASSDGVDIGGALIQAHYARPPQ